MKISELSRNTKETKINVKLNLKGSGNANIDTKIGFFDHMLNTLAKHSGFDLDVNTMVIFMLIHIIQSKIVVSYLVKHLINH